MSSLPHSFFFFPYICSKSDCLKRVILITGASSGLGRATAKFLAQRGNTVYGTSRKAENGDILDNFTMLKLDLLNPESIRSALAYISEKESRLDVLINNGGIGINGPMECLSLEEINLVFQTNVFGLMECCRQAIPYLRKGQKPTIINISSIAGEMGLPYRGAYSSSKFAVEGYSESLSMELKPFGIRVCLVQPGDFATSINENRMVAKSVDLSLYPDFFKMNERVKEEVNSSWSPELMGEYIMKIILSKNPPLRKRVAPFLARFSTLLRRILPGRWYERLLMKFYKV